MQEDIDAERQATKTIQDILLVNHHYVRADFSASKAAHENKMKLLRGIGQENSVPRATH